MHISWFGVLEITWGDPVLTTHQPCKSMFGQDEHVVPVLTHIPAILHSSGVETLQPAVALRDYNPAGEPGAGGWGRRGQL